MLTTPRYSRACDRVYSRYIYQLLSKLEETKSTYISRRSRNKQRKDNFENLLEHRQRRQPSGWVVVIWCAWQLPEVIEAPSGSTSQRRARHHNENTEMGEPQHKHRRTTARSAPSDCSNIEDEEPCTVGTEDTASQKRAICVLAGKYI